MLRKCLLIAFALFILSGCNAVEAPTSAHPITPASTHESLPTATAAVENAEPGITIIGEVMDVSFSARLIMLKDPVEGFSVLALSENCELTSTGEKKVDLHDIQPGMTVQASGQPGASDALLTSFVLVQ